MELHGYDEPVYIISVAADLLKVHPQTLRLYEREGLLEPRRTEANNRLFSLRDLDMVRVIRRLTRDEGVNLAGVKIIINLQKEIEELRARLGEIPLKP
jgi:MerR family transcriptional regulator/heat shock protein HspR